MAEKSKRRIMVVDDEKDVSFALKTMLEKHGYEVDSFNTSHLALQKFKANVYDLVILDVRMPSISGFELSRLIKNMDSQVKIIIISAFELYNETFKPALHNIECVIEKPIDNNKLINEVKLAMGNEC